MLDMRLILISFVGFAAALRSQFNEKLEALSLLGSHFGLVDIPATYDYVIVGGGTAGLTVANRLSKHFTVAVIEAGGFYEIENSNLTEVPANDVYYLGKSPLWNSPLIDWLQYTTPQAGLNGESVLFSQGHTLVSFLLRMSNDRCTQRIQGGSSARNFMWYHRGPRRTYDIWQNVTGDDNWTWNNFLPYLKKPVEFTPPGEYPANLTPKYDESDYSANGGPLQVSYPRFLAPSGAYIGAGLTELGLPELPGMVNGNLLGWMSCGCKIDPTGQTRSSAETSMLRQAIKTNFNLQVYTQALAKKILFNDKNRAVGVKIQVSGVGSGQVIFNLRASKEVIVSAGAFRSPQLLMVSGIGPKETLEANDIEVISERKCVGQNLWDHIWVAITREFNVVTAAALGDPSFLAQSNAEYVQNRTGINTNPAGTLIAFEKLPPGSISETTRRDLDSTFGGGWPDVEYFSQDAYAGTNDDYLLSAPNIRNYSAVAATVVAPFSRGNVTIRSKDTNIHPVVNPNWLTDPRDMEVLVAGFKRVRQLFNTDAVAPGLIGEEVYPGENVTTDAQIEAVIRKSADSVFHPAGTARMGRENDEDAVLDSKARVIGVKGLRVVDASAFPALPPGHPQGTVYGFAEKIAQEILNDS